MLRTNFAARRTFVRLRAGITRLKPCYCSVCPFCIFFSYPLKKAVKKLAFFYSPLTFLFMTYPDCWQIHPQPR